MDIGFKGVIFKILTLIIQTGFRFLNNRDRIRGTMLLAKDITPVMDVDTKYGKIHFLCNDTMPIARAKSFHTKEPGTLAWIDGFDEDSILWDIGANVGLYSLYAALKPNVQVVAFEPAGITFYLLVRNIEINKKDQDIYPLCIALSDVTEFGSLNMPNTQIGKTGHQFNSLVDVHGNTFESVFRQATISYTIDDILLNFSIPFPNYIKIDVDGFENKILKGGGNTLADERLRSILMEMMSDVKHNKNDEMLSIMQSAGFKLKRVADNINYIFSR